METVAFTAWRNLMDLVKICKKHSTVPSSSKYIIITGNEMWLIFFFYVSNVFIASPPLYYETVTKVVSISIVAMCAVLSCSVMSGSVTQWTLAHQAPLPMGFSRQKYWSGLPFPSPIFAILSTIFPHVNTQHVRQL